MISSLLSVLSPWIQKKKFMLISKCLDIDDCKDTPCNNGGTCQDGIASYTCVCPLGFEGTDCELSAFIHYYFTWCYVINWIYHLVQSYCNLDINDCNPNPCKNDGVCKDGINSLTCSCAHGFSGDDCSLSKYHNFWISINITLKEHLSLI